MSFQDYLMDAIDLVLDWDLPDEAIAEAVKGPGQSDGQVQS
jgi:hypothetical protein